MQLAGPVPPELYHRFVEFRPVIGSMFQSKGLRGKILNKALHKQHARIYNFDQSTEYGSFEPCSEQASEQFLKMAHFDEGSRLFTYVLTLDATFRFTETGKQFGIDLLSKHTMHSDVETYVAFSGEFFIRRAKACEPSEKVRNSDDTLDGPSSDAPPSNPSCYELIIDNDSGTYRPNKDMLDTLKGYLERNFPGIKVIVMDCGSDELQDMKKAQRETQKGEPVMQYMMNHSQSSISSAESDLDSRVKKGTDKAHKSKREKALQAVEDPKLVKSTLASKLHKGGDKDGEQAEKSV